jgi:hypothetical protein
MWFGISVEKFTKVFVSDFVRRTISEDPYAFLMWKDLGAGFAVGVVQVDEGVIAGVWAIFSFLRHLFPILMNRLKFKLK